MNDDKVLSLAARRSQRSPLRRIFHCIACNSYSFKLIEEDGEDFIACANCEAWITEFEITKTRPL